MQVFLQLTALLVQPDRGEQNVLFGITVRTAIAISMTIAILNLFKTLVILKNEASDLDLSLWHYVRCAPASTCTVPAFQLSSPGSYPRPPLASIGTPCTRMLFSAGI